MDTGQIFTYVIKALHVALAKAGVPHEVVSEVNVNDTDNTYLLCTVHEPHRTMPPHYISYNFEQLTVYKDIAPLWRRRLEGALMIWDYSKLNTNYLWSQGFPAVHVPFGYSDTMDIEWTQGRHASKGVDFLFVGLINVRRSMVLWDVSAIPRVKTYFGLALGQKLEDLMLQSKVGLNIHQYGGGTILEVHRIIPLIIHRVFVVSEPSTDTWMDAQFKGIVDLANVTAFERVASQALTRADLQEETERRYELLKTACNFNHMVASALSGPMPALIL